MSLARSASLASSIVLTSCTTVPLSRPQELPDMVHHVQCELQQAYGELRADHPWLDKWAAGFTLTMKADVGGAASPEVSLLGPFGVGAYVLAVGGGVSYEGIRTGTSKYYLRFDHLHEVQCAAPNQQQIKGALGIKEWIESVLPPDDKSTYRIPDTIGHSQQFILTLSGHVNPSYTLIRSRGQLGLGASRIDTNIIDIAMTNAPVPKPQEVVIVGTRPAPPPGRTRLAPETPGTMQSFTFRNSQPASPLVQRQRLPSGRTIEVVKNKGSEIPDDARARLDNQLQELQLRNIFGR